MRKLLMMVASCWSLQCAAQSAPPAGEDLGNYIAANAPLAESGKLLWSEFYKQVFAKLVALNASGDMLERESKLIRYAELYESGKIDKSEFEYRRRMLQAEAASADQAAQRAEQAQRAFDQQIAEQQAEQRRQNSVNNIATAIQIMQASGPHTLGGPTAAPALFGNGPTWILKSQSVNGTLRYCQYANGAVNTVSITQICPNTIQ